MGTHPIFESDFDCLTEGMPVYNMYILGKAGHSLFYHEWDRKQKATLSRSEEDKLMSGLIHSLSKFCSKMSTEPDAGNFRGLKTSKFRLHYWESPTGVKMILNTSPEIPPCPDTLSTIYYNIFVPICIKNPLVPSCEPIQSELFQSKLDSFMKNLTFF